MIDGQQIGRVQEATLQPGLPNYSRTILIFDTAEPQASSMPVGTTMTAVLMWTDVFGNVAPLQPPPEVGLILFQAFLPPCNFLLQFRALSWQM